MSNGGFQDSALVVLDLPADHGRFLTTYIATGSFPDTKDIDFSDIRGLETGCRWLLPEEALSFYVECYLHSAANSQCHEIVPQVVSVVLLCDIKSAKLAALKSVIRLFPSVSQTESWRLLREDRPRFVHELMIIMATMINTSSCNNLDYLLSDSIRRNNLEFV